MEWFYFNYPCALRMAQTFILGSAWLHHKSSWKIKPDCVRRKQSILGFFLGQAHRSCWNHGISILVARTAVWFLGRNGFLNWDSHSFCIVESIVYHTEMRRIMQTWDLLFKAFCKFRQTSNIDLKLVNVFKACFAIMSVRKVSRMGGGGGTRGACPLNKNSCSRACDHSCRTYLLLQELLSIFGRYVWWGTLKTFKVNSSYSMCK